MTRMTSHPASRGRRERPVPPSVARLAARWALPPARLVALVVGFAVALLTLAVFAVLADDIASREAILLDSQANLMLHAHATPARDAVMTAISALGTWPVLVPAVLLVAVALGRLRRWHTAVFLMGIAVGGAVLNTALKLLFRRPRPDLHWAVRINSFSFPSGHAMESFVCYIGIAVVVWYVWGRRWGAIMLVLAALLVLVIGISRVYLGVHYVSDVVGGYVAGACWVSSAATAMAGWRFRSSE